MTYSTELKPRAVKDVDALDRATARRGVVVQFEI
jgi:hypothetical protein